MPFECPLTRQSWDSVRLIGQIHNVQHHHGDNESLNFDLIDGTGGIHCKLSKPREYKQQQTMNAAGGLDGVSSSAASLSIASFSKLSCLSVAAELHEFDYVQVIGTLKQETRKYATKHIEVHHLERIKDYDRITEHALESIQSFHLAEKVYHQQQRIEGGGQEISQQIQQTREEREYVNSSASSLSVHNNMSDRVYAPAPMYSSSSVPVLPGKYSSTANTGGNRAYNDPYTPSNRVSAASVHHPLSPLRASVLSAFRELSRYPSSSTSLGRTPEDLAECIHGISLEQIHEELQMMADDGEVYTTSDDFHFALVSEQY